MKEIIKDFLREEVKFEWEKSFINFLLREMEKDFLKVLEKDKCPEYILKIAKDIILKYPLEFDETFFDFIDRNGIEEIELFICRVKDLDYRIGILEYLINIFVDDLIFRLKAYIAENNF